MLKIGILGEIFFKTLDFVIRKDFLSANCLSKQIVSPNQLIRLVLRKRKSPALRQAFTQTILHYGFWSSCVISGLLLISSNGMSIISFGSLYR